MTATATTTAAAKVESRTPVVELNPAVYASAGLGAIVVSASIGLALNNLMVVYAGVGLSLAAIFIGLAAQPLRERTKPAGASTSTNILAILALVAACLGFAVVSIALGHVARGQIIRDGGRGDGIALAALLIGYAEIFLSVLLLVWAITDMQSLH